MSQAVAVQVTQNSGGIRPLASTSGYYASLVSLGLSMAVLGPTLPFLAEQTQTELADISYLFIARSLGYLIGTLGAGRLYDRFAGHRLMAGALVAMAAILFVVPFVPLIWVLAAILFALGLGDGMVDVGCNTLLVWVHRKNVDPYMNALHFFFGVGAFIAPIIIAYAISVSDGISLAYWMIAGLVLLPSIWLVRLRSPRPAHEEDGEAQIPANPTLLVLMAAFFFTFVGAELSYGGWIYTYALRVGVGTETTAAFLTSAFWASMTIGRLVGVPISAWARPQIILTVDIVGCLASLALILIAPLSPVIVWTGSIGMGAFMASMFATGLNFAERRMTMTGKVMSAFLVGSSIGSMVLPWLIGQLFERFSPQITIVTIFIDMLVCGALFVAVLIHSRGIRTYR